MASGLRPISLRPIWCFTASRLYCRLNREPGVRAAAPLRDRAPQDWVRVGRVAPAVFERKLFMAAEILFVLGLVIGFAFF